MSVGAPRDTLRTPRNPHLGTVSAGNTITNNEFSMFVKAPMAPAHARKEDPWGSCWSLGDLWGAPWTPRDQQRDPEGPPRDSLGGPRDLWDPSETNQGIPRGMPRKPRESKDPQGPPGPPGTARGPQGSPRTPQGHLGHPSGPYKNAKPSQVTCLRHRSYAHWKMCTKMGICEPASK